jgi:DNA modification methylase
MKIEQTPIDKLIPYASNSRTHSPEQVAQIAASIKEFGFNNPVLLDKDNGIIAGHGRVLAARKLGLKEVPTIELSHLTDNQRKAYVIADNKLALNAGWDMEMLSLEMGDLRDEGFDLSLIGFNNDELANMFVEKTEGLTDPDAVPDVPDDPVTKPGDVWILGKHRLMCGDSTSIDVLDKLVDNEPVDMWLTDPPYNIEYEGGTKKREAIKNDSMGDGDFRQFLTDAYTAADSVMKHGAVFYIWHADSEGYNFRGAALDTGWRVRQCLVWQKNNSAFGRSDYHWQHEPCLYGWKEGAAHLWATDRKQSTLLVFDRPAKSEQHPTMKPVALFEYQMLNNTKGEDIVLDSFGGSGTTLIAAEMNGRRARVMEFDPKYCDVIIKRWQDFTGLQATLEGSGEYFPTIKADAA